MFEAEHREIDDRFSDDSFQAQVFKRLKQMPESLQERWWPVFNPEDHPKARELFYPAVWAAMDVTDNWARIKEK